MLKRPILSILSFNCIFGTALLTHSPYRRLSNSLLSVCLSFYLSVYHSLLVQYIVSVGQTENSSVQRLIFRQRRRELVFQCVKSPEKAPRISIKDVSSRFLFLRPPPPISNAAFLSNGVSIKLFENRKRMILKSKKDDKNFYLFPSTNEI